MFTWRGAPPTPSALGFPPGGPPSRPRVEWVLKAQATWRLLGRAEDHLIKKALTGWGEGQDLIGEGRAKSRGEGQG